MRYAIRRATRDAFTHAIPALLALGLCACDDDTPDGEPGQPDPFEQVAAERAACRAIEGSQAAEPDGLRIAEVTQLAPLAPGGETTVRVTLAEVSGESFMNYPSIRLTPESPALSVLEPGAGQWFGVFGCEAHTAEFRLAADAEARDDLLLTVTASTLACDRDGGCEGLHAVDVVIAVD